ncbi:hypothetical protein [Rhizobium lusitanum]|uniref:Phage ABA sandwich domain-containing protein n=1 Tax=Rhizobium lusitanum TaxID=293958 RepID=A0A1C3VT40_9HYPH|nr:hypothetical protein [Rhizobium lusitanum]SCB30737.1 hypothetical protein GA0061101_106149 [Rhizobium lusitanum]
MQKLEELIAALEKATGPDRWLDAKIDAALRVGTVKMRSGGFEWAWANFPTWGHHKQARGMCGVQHTNGDLGLIWGSLPFTDSIDAAVSLIGGDEFEMTNLYGVARVTVYNQGDFGPSYGSSECGSLPLAICIAALRSKLTQEKNNAE